MIDDDIDWIPGYPPRLAHAARRVLFPRLPRKKPELDRKSLIPAASGRSGPWKERS